MYFEAKIYKNNKKKLVKDNKLNKRVIMSLFNIYL